MQPKKKKKLTGSAVCLAITDAKNRYRLHNTCKLYSVKLILCEQHFMNGWREGCRWVGREGDKDSGCDPIRKANQQWEVV